jgi:hypothetical protein
MPMGSTMQSMDAGTLRGMPPREQEQVAQILMETGMRIRMLKAQFTIRFQTILVNGVTKTVINMVTIPRGINPTCVSTHLKQMYSLLESRRLIG